MCVCVCVRVYVYRERKRERESTTTADYVAVYFLQIRRFITILESGTYAAFPGCDPLSPPFSLLFPRFPSPFVFSLFFSWLGGVELGRNHILCVLQLKST